MTRYLVGTKLIAELCKRCILKPVPWKDAKSHVVRDELFDAATGSWVSTGFWLLDHAAYRQLTGSHNHGAKRSMPAAVAALLLFFLATPALAQKVGIPPCGPTLAPGTVCVWPATAIRFVLEGPKDTTIPVAVLFAADPPGEERHRIILIDRQFSEPACEPNLPWSRYRARLEWISDCPWVVP